MDARIGFEPMFPDSESGVLPLDDRAKVLADSRGLDPQTSSEVHTAFKAGPARPSG